jgi:hypothetical protein
MVLLKMLLTVAVKDGSQRDMSHGKLGKTGKIVNHNQSGEAAFTGQVQEPGDSFLPISFSTVMMVPHPNMKAIKGRIQFILWPLWNK